MAVHQAEQPAEEHIAATSAPLRHARPREYLVRFAFGASISVAAGIIGLIAGEGLAGVFLAFPAILPATLTMLERRDGTAEAASDVRGAAVGAVGMIAFALVVAALIRPLGGGALILATATWVVVSIALYMGLRGLARVLGERQYLPELSAYEAERPLAVLREHGWTIGVAESCTGGMLTALLTGVPEASNAVRGGVVVYTDEAKQSVLEIDPATLQHHGAVSSLVAREMAVAAKRILGSDVGLAITGVAGTSIEGKPPGLTYIALCMPDDRVLVRRGAES